MNGDEVERQLLIGEWPDLDYLTLRHLADKTKNKGQPKVLEEGHCCDYARSQKPIQLRYFSDTFRIKTS